ncbi:hypothetical protein [Streptomyces sp. NPDC051569]|uniref:hypothetical protein n=1 Tax=Streptomyces sp. NPDC051569 TaxID=3365661 RepID=UPI003793D0FA
MDLLLVADSIADELRRESIAAHTGIGGRRPGGAAEGLWERLAAHVGAVPERE